MKLKGYIVLLLIFTALSVCCVYGDEDIKILVNNQPVESEAKPVIIEGTTFVPLRPVAEAMGCEVFWVAESQIINIRNKTTIVGMQIGNDKISRQKRTSEGQTTILNCDKPPLMYNGSAYIPLRSMAEAFGATVAWDSATRTVIIVYDTTVKYVNSTLEVFAGNGLRKRIDGSLAETGFLSPESMDTTADGTIVISDSGSIRTIKDGVSKTVKFEPSYIIPDTIRTCGNDIYFTTKAFENENNEKYCGIVKLNNDTAEGIFLTEAVFSRIDDFDVDNSGNIYAIYYNAGLSKKYLSRITGNDIVHLMEIDDGFGCITIDDTGKVYLGNTVRGTIYQYDIQSNHLRLFAGVDDNTNFVDGQNPLFFDPRAMKYYNGSLYIVDYNLIRKLDIYGGELVECNTVAGKISAEAHPATKPGKASEAEISPSYLMDIAIINGNVYITDPDNDYVYVIK